MNSTVTIILAVFGGVIAVLAASIVLAGRRQRSLREETLTEMLAIVGGVPRRIDEQVNCFGLESKGVGQVRGTGCLAATDETIAFILWYPRRTLRVPRSSIVGVDTPTTHLGKSRSRPLLRIRFITDSGGEDAIAWWVRDLPAWLAELSPPHG